MARCFAMERSVSYVLLYLNKPILATRLVEILLKVVQVRNNCSDDMML